MADLRGLGWCLLAAALIAASAPVRAQTAAPAEGLFAGAREALKQGDYERACRLFRESDRIEPAIGTKFNLADCEEKRGRVATAWGLFRVVAQDPAAGKERARIAEDRARALAPRIARLTLALRPDAPQNTFVKIGETEISAGGMGAPIPLDPGRHEIAIGAPGRQERRVVVEIAEAKDHTIEVFPGPPSQVEAAVVPPPLAPVTPTAARSEPVPPTTARDGASTTGRPVVGWVLGGVGLAGIGVGAVTGVFALGEKSTGDEGCADATKTCSQTAADANDAARTLSVVSTVSFIAGGALLGGGVLVLVLGGGDDAKPSSALVSVSPGGFRYLQRF